LEASLALADLLLKKGMAEKTIDIGFRRIICRTPQKKEIDILSRYYKEQLAAFIKDSTAAEKIVNVGYYKPAATSKAELAALMLTMQIIYNMEEAITKT
jgi:hypothetical protein